MNGTLLTAWLTELVLITYRGARSGQNATNPIAGLSVPADYAGSFLIFGALSLIPGQGQRVASVFGWGLVLATGLNIFSTPAVAVNAAPATIVNAPGPKQKNNTVTTQK